MRVDVKVKNRFLIGFWSEMIIFGSKFDFVCYGHAIIFIGSPIQTNWFEANPDSVRHGIKRSSFEFIKKPMLGLYIWTIYSELCFFQLS